MEKMVHENGNSGMKTKINIRLVLSLIVTLAALGTSVHFLHAYQVRRSAAEILAQAIEAKEQKKFAEAAEYFGTYLGYRPEDLDAQARLGMVWAELAQTPRARVATFVYLDNVLRKEPNRNDVRLKVAELALSLGRYDEARKNLQTLLNNSPDNWEYKYLLGQCAEGAFEENSTVPDYATAAEWYDRAIVDRNDKVEIYERLAGVLRHLNREDEAQETLEEMIAANPQSYEAYLVRSRDEKSRGVKEPDAKAKKDLFDAAQKDMEQARKLAPDEARVLLAAAELAQLCEKKGDARKILKRGVDLHPKDIRFAQHLARLELADKRPKEALEIVRQSLKEKSSAAELWDTAELLIDMKEWDEAEKVIASIRQDTTVGSVAGYLDGRVLFGKERWLVASKKLDEVVPLLSRSQETAASLGKRAYVMLGDCYGRLGNTDQQLSAFRQAVKIDPSWEPARAGLASALAATGRADEALAEYRKLSTELPEMQLAAARLLVVRNLRLPPTQRKWAELEVRLSEMAKIDSLKEDAVLLRAEMLAASDQLPTARKLLEEEGKRSPKSLAVWVARAGVARKAGDPKREREILQEARERLGDSAGLRLAMTRYWARSSDPQAGKRLDELAGGVDRLSTRDQASIYIALANAYAGKGDVEKARDYLVELTKSQPQELQPYLLLFDLALKSGDNSGMGEALAAIERVEGRGALWNYGEAARLISQAKKDNGEALLAEARTRLADVFKLRPGWARASLLQAELEEQDKKYDAAIASYRQAIEQGENRPAVIRRVVQLLYERGRYNEAHLVLEKLEEQDQAAFSAEIGKMAAQISLESKDYDRAVDLARKTAAGSKDFRDHIWLGQVLAAAPNRAGEAEKALREAVDRFTNVPDVWIALVAFQAARDRGKAEATLKRAQQKLPAESIARVLGLGYEVLGQLDEAEKCYEKEVAAKPDAAAALHQLADFYFRTGRPQLAKPSLKHMLAQKTKTSAEEVAWARRSLAVETAVTGGFVQIQQAKELIGENLKIDGGSIEDRVAEAVILSVLPEERRRAIDILEKALALKTPTDRESFLLARAYEINGNWQEARQRMLRLLASDRAEPRFIAHFIATLLNRNEPEEAHVWLGRLEEVAGGSLLAVELSARVLHATGRDAEAVKVLQDYAQKDKADLRVVATILDQIGQAEQAEDLFRRWERDTKAPESALVLADFLGRHGKTSEALSFCRKALQSGSSPMAVAGVGIATLRQHQASPEFHRAIEEVLQGALQKETDPVRSLMGLAELREIQGKYAEVVAIYREVLKKDPGNVVALNNLAWYLALQGESAQEALMFADRAIALAGQQPGLVDTRAVAELKLGKTREAVEHLQQVIKEQPTPSRLFHLARAQSIAKMPEAAAKTLADAHTKGLKPEILHPLERDQYEPLVASLKK
jgi:tetratricopeptide (TPR) repeat protein